MTEQADRQLVPKEPTPDMRIAGGIAWSDALPSAATYVDTADACYRAMLAAAPTLPTAGVTEEIAFDDAAVLRLVELVDYSKGKVWPKQVHLSFGEWEVIKSRLLSLLPKATPGVNAEMLTELKRLHEMYGHQATADIIAKAEAAHKVKSDSG